MGSLTLLNRQCNRCLGPVLPVFVATILVLGSGCASLTEPDDTTDLTADADDDRLVTESELLAAHDLAPDFSAPTDELFAAAPVGHYDPEIAIAWVDLAYDLVKEGTLSPPVASRVYAYTGITLYEAVVPGMRDYRSLVGQLHGLHWVPPGGHGRYHWPTVANEALATILTSLFRDSAPALASIEALRDSYADAYRRQLPRGVFLRSWARGKAVGLAMAFWARRDGFSDNHNCSFTPPVGDGLWVPTPPAFAPPLEPCWEQMRTFVLPHASECDPGPPIAYSEEPGSDFYLEALEVYDTVQGLTAEQLTIARFWADGPGTTGTPPGHCMKIASQCLTQSDHNLAEAAECFAKVGIAVGDAFIACWWTKYEYNLLRPITYIRDLIDPAWVTAIPTPPFPEYTSGHSVQSGAAAEVLTDLFGELPFTDHSHDALGFAPRSFSNFFEAAEEAAISRLYGGIHFRAAITRGIEQGRCVGARVNQLEFRECGNQQVAAVYGSQ